MITNVAIALTLVLAGPVAAGQARPRAMRILRAALVSQTRWIKVHAAEALLAADAAASRDRVARAFERELHAYGSEPEYRIGIWRVLAQTARSGGARDRWVRPIAAAFLNERGPDRLHAAETLGKLAYRARAAELAAFEGASDGDSGPLAANALWVLVTSGHPDAERRLADLLRASDAATRTTAAYALRYLPALRPGTWQQLSDAVSAEPSDDIVRASLAAAAFVHAPADRKAAYAAMVARYAQTGTADMKSEACGALAMAGASGDEALVTPLLSDENVDVRVAAARAIVEIERRGER